MSELGEERKAEDKGRSSRLLRTSKQYAVAKGMGCTGVHIGGHGITYEMVEHIIDQGVDSICCKEDIHDKGPGLMFYRFGIDVRKTEADDLETLLQDYFNRSASVFPKESL